MTLALVVLLCVGLVSAAVFVGCQRGRRERGGYDPRYALYLRALADVDTRGPP